MGEKILVKEILTGDLIEAGRKLIALIKESSFELTACYWIYLQEINSWRLKIASSNINQTGAKNAYEQIEKSLEQLPDDTINIVNISILDKNDEEIQILKKLIKDSNKKTNLRISKSAINGHFIDDVYIYFINE